MVRYGLSLNNFRFGGIRSIGNADINKCIDDNYFGKLRFNYTARTIQK